MGSTMSEKILAVAAGRNQVVAGEIVTARVDLAMANDFTAPLALESMRSAGIDRVFDPERVCIVAGRHAPFRDSALADAVASLERFCKSQGIRNFFGYGEGMDHALVPELGLIRPGMLVCNADSHTCTYGALGAFGVPMGSTDMAYIFAFGETWLRVPETIRVIYSGELQPFVTSKDMILTTVGRLGVDGARYKAIEFSGPALAKLSVDERFTITNMAIEMGAKTGMIAPDAVTAAYLATRTPVPWAPVLSDTDAAFEQTIEIDVSHLPPVVARPFNPSDVVPVTEVAGTKVTQVTIGTCTNGRIIDLEQAAQLLRGKKVAKGTRLLVTPASNIVYQQAREKGLLDVFLSAGAIVNPPGCGPCAGIHMGVLGETDVCLATHNRNFHGRMGHKDAQIYLASPYVAAATAVAGAIADPREML